MKQGVLLFAATAAFLTGALEVHAQTPPQTVPVPTPGDVFLGVRASGGTGASDSYLVNLGPDTQFSSAAVGSTFSITTVHGLPIGNIEADLAAKYGNDWFTRTDLFWGLFATKNAIDPTVFGSKERPSASTASIPWLALADTDRNGTASAIVSVLDPTGPGGYRGRTSTSNSLVATFQENLPGGANKYFTQVATAGTLDFSTYSGWSSIEAVVSKPLDLYRISASTTAPVTRLGYFTLSGTGTVTFNKPSNVVTPDPNSDDDGDGFTYAQEEAAGTNPNSGADFFHVSSITRGTGSAAFGFKPAASRTYTLQYSANLSGSWLDIATYSSPASPPTTQQLTDTDPVRTAQPRGFYRIRVSNP